MARGRSLTSLTFACAFLPQIGWAAAPTPAPEARIQRPAVQRPPFGGRGVLAASGALTGLGWVSRFIGIGLGMRYPGFCVFGECPDPSRSTAWRVFNYAPPFVQLAATGLVIPGGELAGSMDAWKSAFEGGSKRDVQAFIVAGAVLFSVFTATSIALRPAVLVPCFSGTGGCEGPGSYVGYSLAAQSSDTLSTVGAGLLTYGVAYRKASRDYGAELSFGPFGSRGAHGLSLAGRF